MTASAEARRAERGAARVALLRRAYAEVPEDVPEALAEALRKLAGVKENA